MRDLVIDTNVFSYVFKGDSRAALYEQHLRGNRLHLCFATVAELYRWAIVRQWGPRLIQTLGNGLRGYEILGYDDESAWKWAHVVSIKGRPVAPGDAWIAAIALRHNMPLVTHNRKHFDFISGLIVISEA